MFSPNSATPFSATRRRKPGRRPTPTFRALSAPSFGRPPQPPPSIRPTPALSSPRHASIPTDTDGTDRLARLSNDRFNNLVPRHFDGLHLTLPSTSRAIRFYDHQKRAIWRIIAAGSTYIAHAVGAGKTYSIAAALMEQK